MRKDGVLFHAKHAFMPNSLGYCGPDENGSIRERLEGGREEEVLLGTLRRFEAAYPFLRLIARSSGRDVFDYSVPEAYWIGSPLLEEVPPGEFYGFSKRELRGNGMKSLQGSFKLLDGTALPHHSFYVMGTYIGAGGDGPKLGEEKGKKIGELIDSCRISWGEVKGKSKDSLVVEARPITVGEGGLGLGGPQRKSVKYDPLVEPFGEVKAGDTVSIHWGYACDVLTRRQVANIERYTAADIRGANAMLRKRRV